MQALLGPEAIEEIEVTGRPVRNPPPQAMNIDVSPLSQLVDPNELQRSMPLEGLPEHKGMFGVKGTLRDILGMVGDAFLLQSGNKEIYAPHRRQEQISDAMVGFGPGQERDAIARVAQIDPDRATKMYENWQARNAKQETETRQQSNLDRQNTLAQHRIKLDKAKIVQAMDPELVRQNLEIIKDYIDDPEKSITDLPPELISAAGLTQNQRGNLGLGAERVDIARQNANTSAQRASRPPAPTKESDSDKYIRIGNIPPEKRSAGEQSWFESKQPKGRRGNVSGFGNKPTTSTPAKPTTGWSVRQKM